MSQKLLIVRQYSTNSQRASYDLFVNHASNVLALKQIKDTSQREMLYAFQRIFD